MKPIIGITANYSYDDKIGEITRLGGLRQEWQLLANDYVKSIEKAGGIPVIIPIYSTLSNIESVINILDGILFSGGNDIDPNHYNEKFSNKIGSIVPERDMQELTLMKKILFKTNIPILGICRGHQLLNVACGGNLYQDMISEELEDHFFLSSPMNYTVHTVDIQDSSKFKEIFLSNKIHVNSYHHQAVRQLGKNLVATAYDDKGVIEAIELKSDNNRFILGVQWHPETLVDKHESHLNIFKSFIKACKIKEEFDDYFE